MVRVASLLIVAALVLPGCSQPDEPRADHAPAAPVVATQTAPARTTVDVTKGRPRIVFLGDSLTAGLGLVKDQAVPALIQAHLDREGYPYEVVNAGVSGDTSAGGLSRLDWSLDGNVYAL